MGSRICTYHALALLLACGSLVGCRQQHDTDEYNIRTPADADGEFIPVASDPRASYSLLHWSAMQNGHREALTRRDGPSGTSYARREIDCERMRFRYLGEGDTREEAEADAPNRGEMAELVHGSISREVSEYVCQR
jgi:hypothetical protein